MSPGRGWLNLEAGVNVVNVIPDNTFFEGEPSFKFLKLSKMTRLYGFGACTLGGFVLSLVGSIMLTLGAVPLFAILYSLGTVISLVGTGFIIGFFRQLKLMFKPVRVVATIILVASIALVLVGAFALDNAILCIIFVVIQFLAYLWYTLSYIPYARDAVKKMAGF